MKYGFSAEIDSSIPMREFGRIQSKIGEVIEEKLARSPFSSSDLTLIYCPIVMAPDLAISYPPRSRFLSKSGTLSVAPQLSHSAYLLGDYAERWSIVVLGHLDVVPLMKRAKLDPLIIQSIETLLTDLAAAPE